MSDPIEEAWREVVAAAHRELGDPKPARDPRLALALDRSLSLDARRSAYADWAGERTGHWHPGHPRHRHAGGDRVHTHPEGDSAE